MSECPSCGRFTGPYANCPYCGARLQGRTQLRILKIAALVLTVAGMAGLWFAATRVRVPQVPISQVGGLMNMAYVRIAGRVSRGPEYDPQAQSLAFWLVDETGEEIRVAAYRNDTQDLIRRRKIPVVEDQVSVLGNLRIRDDFRALYLNAPDQLIITRTAPVEMEIGRITALDIGKRVRVRGRVRQVFSPYEGLTLVSLGDAGGRVDIAISQALEQLTGPLPPFAPGQPLEVVAAVTAYRDRVQLAPASTADLVPLDSLAGLAQPRPIGSLTSADVDAWVQVQGRIVEADSFSSGIRFTLDDGSGQVTLLLWDSVYAAIPYSATLDVGAQVQAQGSVAQYKGTLEIVPELPEDIAILVAAPPPPEVTVAALSPQDVGRPVQVQGRIVESDPFSSGIRFTLDDGSGQITLLLWDSVYAAIPYSATLEVGAEVRVVGAVAEYKGALEIVPQDPHDVTILVGASPPEEKAVAALGTEDVGRVVVLRGVLGPSEPFSRGVRYTLDDGSGQVTLLLWSDVAAEAPAGVGAGAEVRVTGAIAEYQGRLEIVPRRGSDLQVLAPGEEPTATVTPLGQITADDAERFLTVEGTLGEMETFSQGVRFPLRDDSGEITLLLWQNVYDAFPGAGKLSAGVRVRVTGRIAVYRGALEIVPEAAGITIVE